MFVNIPFFVQNVDLKSLICAIIEINENLYIEGFPSVLYVYIFFIFCSVFDVKKNTYV